MTTFTRRDAIRAGVLSAAYLFTSSGVARAGSKKNSATGSEEIIIVIGAGMAGLTVAARLQASGFQLVVLEARSRPGGRILSDHSLGVSIDLGAAWIHGDSKKNPLMKWVKELNIETRKTDWDSLFLYDSEEGELADATYSKFYRKFEYVLEQLYDIRETIGTSRSIAESIDKAVKGSGTTGVVQRGLQLLGDIHDALLLDVLHEIHALGPVLEILAPEAQMLEELLLDLHLRDLPEPVLQGRNQEAESGLVSRAGQVVHVAAHGADQAPSRRPLRRSRTLPEDLLVPGALEPAALQEHSSQLLHP